MNVYILLFMAQLLNSFFSTSVVYFSLKESCLKFISITMLNDIIKLTVIGLVSKQFIIGDYIAVIAAVLGGIVGNVLSFKFMKK